MQTKCGSYVQSATLLVHFGPQIYYYYYYYYYYYCPCYHFYEGYLQLCTCNKQCF